MLNSERRAGAASRISAAGRLAAVSVGAGLLVAAVAVPVVGAAGVIARNAANTFNTLKVPSLGQIPSRSEILTQTATLIAYYYPNDIYRIPVSYNQIAPVMRNAIVAIEDSRFYLHGAFDLRGTLRALANDLSNSGSTQGGSTLAQEYVKNALILTATTTSSSRTPRPSPRSAGRSASCGWPADRRARDDQGPVARRLPQRRLLREQRPTASRWPRNATSAPARRT